jgi:hypothetical protein
MKRWMILGILVFLVQVGLTVATQIIRHADDIKSGKGPLLKLTAAEVNEAVLEDGEGRRLTLKKEQGKWLLPDMGSFPADTARVQGLIDRLAGLQRGWPEATTAEAAGRFKVAADRFERKLSLRKDGTLLGTVFFGASAGLRKSYLRVDGDSDIQTLAIAQHELEVKADGWIDTGILRLKPEQVVRISLPGLRLERGADGLQPPDITASEEMVKDRRDQLVKQLTGLTISGLLGTTEKPEYGLEKPVLRYTVELDGGTAIGYIFGQEKKPVQAGEQEGASPGTEQPLVLKVSNQAQLFRLDNWQIEEIRKANRASLVRAKEHQPAEVPETATKPEGQGQ